jgi:hypothetical protein
MTFHRPLTTDAERAGRALAHSFALLLPEPAVRVLANIAAGTTPTTAERRLLGEVLRAIDVAEVTISRRAA